MARTAHLNSSQLCRLIYVVWLDPAWCQVLTSWAACLCWRSQKKDREVQTEHPSKSPHVLQPSWRVDGHVHAVLTFRLLKLACSSAQEDCRKQLAQHCSWPASTTPLVATWQSRTRTH